MRDIEKWKVAKHRWYEEVKRPRKQKWIADNGPCQHCGSWENLEVDHVDPKQKEYQTRSIWGLCEEKRMKELAKCQVLCHDCHRIKTNNDMDQGYIVHGNPYRGYKRGCRCKECKAAHAANKAREREKHGRWEHRQNQRLAVV